MSRVDFGTEIVDHGGGVDAAAIRWGGLRRDWLDLSTGINPRPYTIPALPPEDYAALPDQAAQDALVSAARKFWMVPPTAALLAAPGASALIARIPALRAPGRVKIAQPTYNEHGRAFQGQGWQSVAEGADATVIVHPNNPDGRFHDMPESGLTVVDESFCDTDPDRSLIAHAARPGVIILKSFGKFWGLAGLRLGFAIGDPGLIKELARMMGPWPVSGPALRIGAQALHDGDWATTTRHRLKKDAERLDDMMRAVGAQVVGGTPLFRLFNVPSASSWQERLACQRIWTRVFPYSQHWLRLGLPGCEEDWARLQRALTS